MSERSDELAALRRRIDETDREILALLGKRMATVGEVGRYKQAHDLAPFDSARWEALLAERLEMAKSLGLSDEFITKLYQLIHDYALQIEAEAARKASQ